MTAFFAATLFASTRLQSSGVQSSGVQSSGGRSPEDCLVCKGPKSLGRISGQRLAMGLLLALGGVGLLAPGALAQVLAADSLAADSPAEESPLPAPAGQAEEFGQAEESFERVRPGSQGLEAEFDAEAIAVPEAQPSVSQPPATQPPVMRPPGTQPQVMPPPATQPPASPTLAEPQQQRVYLAGKQVSFEPPQGFTAMGRDEIAQKFPGTMPPQYAYANAGREVSVGISLSDIALATEQLPEARQFLADFLESSVPGFQWIENDFVNLGGQDWIKLEFLSQDSDRQVHNDLYITSLDGRLLGFNFNAPLDLNAQLRPLLEDSRNSIQVEPSPAVAADPLPEPEATVEQ